MRVNCPIYINNIISRPCSQIDEEIEDIDEAGIAGDDSEITCINSLEMKQVRYKLDTNNIVR